MSLSHWFDQLTHSQRRRILNGLRADLGTFGGPVLDDDALEEVARHAIDGYHAVVGQERELEAFDNGFAEADGSGKVAAHG